MPTEEELNEMEEMLAEAYNNGKEDLLKEMQAGPSNGLGEIKNLITELSGVRKLYKDMSSTFDHIKEKKAQLEEALDKALENAGLQNVKGEDGTTYYRREQFFASVKAQDKPAFFQWLRDHGMGDIIKEDVHAKTLTAFVKEQMEQDNPLPGYVSTFTRNTIGYRGGK